MLISKVREGKTEKESQGKERREGGRQGRRRKEGQREGGRDRYNFG